MSNEPMTDEELAAIRKRAELAKRCSSQIWNHGWNACGSAVKPNGKCARFGHDNEVNHDRDALLAELGKREKALDEMAEELARVEQVSAYRKYHADRADKEAQEWREAAHALREALDRIRDLHEQTLLDECNECDQPFPCSTVRTLDEQA